MIRVIAKRYVIAGRMEEYIRVVEALVEETRREPGCVEYGFAANREQSLGVMIELWSDRAALAVHAQRLQDSGWQERLASFADPARGGGVEILDVVY